MNSLDAQYRKRASQYLGAITENLICFINMKTTLIEESNLDRLDTMLPKYLLGIFIFIIVCLCIHS